MASEMSNAKGDGRKGSNRWTKNKKTVCDKQEEKLKRLGMYEKGMTAAETTEMLSIIEESKKGAAAGSNVKICKESDAETSSDDTALVCLSPELFTDDGKQPKASGSPKRNDAVKLSDKKSTTGFDPWLGSGHGESRSPQLRIKQWYKYKIQKSSTSDSLKSRLATAKILKHLENYYQRLHFVQRQSLNYMKWGEPVIVGRHMEDTIDRYTRSRKNYFKAVDDQEEVGKKTEEPSPKTSDDDDKDFQPSISRRVNRNTGDDDDKDFQPSINKGMDRKNTAGLQPEKPNGSSLKPKRFYSPSPCVNFNLETTDNKSDDEVSSGEDYKLPELETGATEKQAAPHHLQFVFRAKTSPKRQTDDDEISNCRMPETGNTVYRKWRETHSSIEQRSAVLGGNVKVKSNKIGLGAHGENDWLSRRSPPCTYSGSKRSKLGNRGGSRKKLSLTQVSKLMPSPSQDADENSKCLAMKPHPNKRQRIENVDEENVDSNTSAPRSTNPSSPKVFDLVSALDQDVANGQSDVPCPLCGISFAWNVIEDHAADCEGLKTDLALETRTPKNHNRCYICRGAFPEATYRDHVRRCIAIRNRLPQSPPCPPKTLLTPACPSSSNSSSTKLLRRLDDHQLDDDVSLPSPVISRVPLKKRALLNSKISDGNISLSHVTTSPFATFHPISKQPDSTIDFKNQFSKRQMLVRKVITKKRTTKKKRKRKSSRRSQRL